MEKKKIIIIAVVAVIIVCVIGFVAINMNKSKNKSTTVSNNTTKTDKKEPTIINLGEQITNSDMEMTFVSVDFKDEIKWRTSEYSTRSAAMSDGKIGVSISGTLKNLRGEAINASNIIGKVIVNDKYTYDLSLTPHVSGYTIDPLETKEYDFYAQVPPEIKETYTKMEFIFGFNNDLGYITTQYINGKMLDKYEKLENLYSLTITK